MYDNGKGVPRDANEAVKWYRLAAEQELAVAQNNLGLMHLNGQGVAKDVVRAYMWVNLAVLSSSSVEEEKTAMNNRDAIALKMTPAQIAEAQNLTRRCQAGDSRQCDCPQCKTESAFGQEQSVPLPDADGAKRQLLSQAPIGR